MPCLITCLSELNDPRYMTPGGIFDACEAEITTWGRADWLAWMTLTSV